jgi:hypothetical protein
MNRPRWVPLLLLPMWLLGIQGDLAAQSPCPALKLDKPWKKNVVVTVQGLSSLDSIGSGVKTQVIAAMNQWQ